LLHVQINKNKRSVTLDLRTKAGLDVFWKLHSSCDVFVDGTVAGSCDRLGIGYEKQKMHKADIVYCQYTGFGASGPYSTVPAHGLMFGALAGTMPHALGEDGYMHPDTNQTPVTARGGEASAAGGIHAALGIAAALVQRAQTGEGCYIDVASSDGVMAQAWFDLVTALNQHRVTDESTIRGLSDMSGARYNLYEAKDGQVMMIAALEPKFWANFCTAVGRPELIHDDSSTLMDYGVEEGLRDEVQVIFRTRTVDQWMAIAREYDIPICPAPRTTDELLTDPQIAGRQMVIDGEHPAIGDFRFVTSPVKVRGQEYELRRHAPSRGEQTTEVFKEIGLTDDDIARLRSENVI
jgi:crotonobetainyl-CoA:carnitine CoA-transferase CaiB-like acyl-CoA transferase